MRRSLVLLTSTFPFGTSGEPFLETEIGVLADRFDRVFVVPSYRRAGQRALPANAEIVEMDWLDEPNFGVRARALASTRAIGAVARTLCRSSNLKPYTRGAKTYLDLLARNLLKMRSLRRLVASRNLAGAVFYDYWFENSTLALALLRRSGGIATAVSRGHRFDIYDEAWRYGRLPFAESKIRFLDAVFAVSEHGGAYLRHRFPRDAGKVHVARLGVRDPGLAPPVRNSATRLVVSCSALRPVKAVHLIPEALAVLDRPVRWVHLGDGPERDAVHATATRLLDGKIEWELAGQIANTDVLRFYQRHPVDLFVSLSRSEGLPVSMMEAQSHGVPIVARAVQGVPEIVTEDTGVRLSPDATPAHAASAIELALEPGRFQPERIHSFFLERFEARTNYNLFADALIALADRGRAIP